MKTYRRQVHSMVLVSLLMVLTSPWVVRSQTQGVVAARPSDPSKLAGAVRIGLVTPRVSLIGGGGNVTQQTSSLRQSVRSYLTGPRIGTIDLRARLDSLALEEGRERACDYVLYTTLIRRTQSGGPAMGTIYAVGAKAGDEFSFEYKLVSTGSLEEVLAESAQARVSADGQDVLSPMIEAAAQTIVDLVRTAKPDTVTGPTGAGPANETTSGNVITTRPKTATVKDASDPPKARDAVRIGIVTPRISLIGGGTPGSSDATSLRQTITSFLTGPTIETIDLKARLESQALAEAKKRECDYVLFTSLIRKRSVHTGRGPLSTITGSIAGSALGKIPGAQTARKVGTEASSVGHSIAALTRANDEVTFEYRLVTPDGAGALITKAEKAKVNKDGDDVITPMIETASEALLQAARKQ